MASKKALGKGLRALIPDIPPDEPREGESIQFIQVAKVSPNPFQPREKFNPETLSELRNSIAEKGVIQPITVRRWDDGFQLISGERRLRAVRDLGLETIPAFILDVQSDEEMLELSIIENIHREDLTAVDIAKGYKRLIDECHLTQEEVAQKVGKDRTTVTNFLRILKLPRRVQESLQNGELSMGHARALLSLSSSEKQIALWKEIVRKQLSVRKVEELVREQGKKKSSAARDPEQEAKSIYLQDIENKLRTRLTTRVNVKAKKKGGSIEIDYYSDDDLDRLVSLICDE